MYKQSSKTCSFIVQIALVFYTLIVYFNTVNAGMDLRNTNSHVHGWAD